MRRAGCTSSYGACVMLGVLHIFVEQECARRLAQDLSHPLITMLQQECTRSTCPEMKAGEWLYLCVAHGNDGAMEVSMLFSRSLTYSSLLPSNAVPSTTSCIHSTVLPHCSTHLVLSRQGTRLLHSQFGRESLLTLSLQIICPSYFSPPLFLACPTPRSYLRTRLFPPPRGIRAG